MSKDQKTEKSISPKILREYEDIQKKVSIETEKTIKRAKTTDDIAQEKVSTVDKLSEKPQSSWQKVKDTTKTVGSVAIDAISDPISSAKGAASFVEEKTANTKIGKFFQEGNAKTFMDGVKNIGKIATSNLVQKVALGIAGATAATVGAVGVGIVAVTTALGIGFDTKKRMKNTKEAMELTEEYNALTNISNNIAVRKELFAQKGTELKAIKEHLAVTDKSITSPTTSSPKENKSKSHTIKGIKEGIKDVAIDTGLEILNEAGNAVAGSEISAIVTAGKDILTNPTLGGVTKGIISIASGAKGEIEKRNQINQIKEETNKMRKKPGMPQYNNINELKIAERAQEVTTQALQEYIKDKNAYKLQPKNQVKRFKSIKQAIEKTIPPITQAKNKDEGWLKNTIKDIGTSMNPLNQYYEGITEVKLQGKSGIAAGQEAMEKHKNTPTVDKPFNQKQVILDPSQSISQEERTKLTANLKQFQAKMNSKIGTPSNTTISPAKKKSTVNKSSNSR